MEIEVILLEPVRKLGTVGSVVKVKGGFARNFLIPKNKAIRATEANKKSFEDKRKHIESKHNENKSNAEVLASKINGSVLNIIRQASDDGRLFGSVSGKEIASLLSNSDTKVSYLSIALPNPIKTLGIYEVEILPYEGVRALITVNVARSESEAQVALRDYQNKSSEEESSSEDL